MKRLSPVEAESPLAEERLPDNVFRFIENIKEIPYAKSTAIRTASGGYGQDWKAYHKAQANEKLLFRIILRDLCDMVENQSKGRGRPPLPLGDIIFSAGFMVYSNHPGKRFDTDLKELEINGFISKAPHPNTIYYKLRMEAITPLLTSLIEITSLPLKDFEVEIAADSTGLTTDRYARWVNDRTKEEKVRRKWVKLHLMCGKRTNIVTSVIVTPGEDSDLPQFGRLLAATRRNYSPKEIYADAGYISGENVRHAVMAGAVPFIMFKSNYVLDANYKSTVWKSLLKLFKERYWVYMSYYNKRNNVETTFSMIKGKFGGRLRAVDERAQINETLLKVLCHNICVLIHSFYALNIDITFPSETSISIEHGPTEPHQFSVAGGRIVGVIGDRSNGQKPTTFTRKSRQKAKKHSHEGQLPLFD